MKAKKKAKKRSVPLAGMRDPTSQLYRAVIRYIESKGGSLMVIGGVSVLEWPGERKGMYGLQIKILGRKPKYAEPTNPKQGE